MRIDVLASVLVLAALVAGCGAAPTKQDPFEPVNRALRALTTIT